MFQCADIAKVPNFTQHIELPPVLYNKKCVRILVAIPVFAVYNKNMNTDSRKVCANFKSKVCDYADNFMLKGD